VEISYVRNRLRGALDAAKQRAAERRERVATAERAFDQFLAIAAPLARQLAAALKAEGHAFAVSTPERLVRLVSERRRDDFIELRLDTDTAPAQVLGRIRFTRGSRTIDVERPLEPGVSPDRVSEEDVLDFLLEGLEPML
jgi:hypothetical protein